MRDALVLQEEILRHIPHVALKQRPTMQEDLKPEGIQGPFEFASTFYGLKAFSLKPVIRNCHDIPFVTTLEDLILISTSCATSLLNPSPNASTIREVFSQSILLIMRLLGRMDQRSGPPFVAQWDPERWLSTILQCLEQVVGKIHVFLVKR